MNNLLTRSYHSFDNFVTKQHDESVLNGNCILSIIFFNFNRNLNVTSALSITFLERNKLSPARSFQWSFRIGALCGLISNYGDYSKTKKELNHIV